MTTPTGSQGGGPARPPSAAIARAAPELARMLAELAGDLVLVLEADGRVRTVASASAADDGASLSACEGRAWSDCVAADSAPKARALVEEAMRTGRSRWREINHPVPGGGLQPFAFSAVRLGPKGPVLAVGRGLAAAMRLQQRFLRQQQALERGYWQALRQPDHEPHATEALADALEELSAEVGRCPLPELLQRAASAVERHFLEAALDRAGGDPAEAARLLGITPQALARRRRALK